MTEDFRIDQQLVFAILNGKVSTAINRKLSRNFRQEGVEITPEQWTILLALWPVHIPPVNSPEKVSRRDDAVRVYLFEENPQGWCCPNCQCENDSRRTNCCVCNYKRG